MQALSNLEISLTIPRSSVALGNRILLAHELALFRVPVPPYPRVVINAGCCVDPDLASFRLSQEIAGGI
jgi:hypothetical protein